MFENSLIDLEQNKQSRRWGLLPVAVGLHVAVLASVGLAQAWNVAPVAEPEVAMVGLYDEPIPLLPPAAPPAGGGQTRPTAEPVRPTTPVQPDADRLPETLTDPEPATGTGPVIEGGSPFGREDGLIGGIEGGEGTELADGGGGIGWDGPVGTPEPQNEVVRFNGTMTRPVQLSGRQPRYNELARKAGVQGVVILEAVIDKKGRVGNVRVLKNLPMGLDTEAVAAVQEWIFEPAMLDGRPVAVYYTLTVNFQIQR